MPLARPFHFQIGQKFHEWCHDHDRRENFLTYVCKNIQSFLNFRHFVVMLAMGNQLHLEIGQSPPATDVECNMCSERAPVRLCHIAATYVLHRTLGMVHTKVQSNHCNVL